jgi:uncharacterized protein (DUF1778 family)
MTKAPLRDTVFSIRLSPKEKAEIEKAAEIVEGLPRSFARDAVVKAARKVIKDAKK